MVNSGNDYVLQVKGNQPTLRAAARARAAADPAPALHSHTHQERRNGCLNTWQTVFYPGVGPDVQAAWAGAAGFVVVHKTVRGPHTCTQQTRYYLTSLAACPVAEFAAGIRGHWGIENNLHRARDVQFGQDTNGIRHRTAAVNACIFNTLALNFLLANVAPSLSYAQLFFSQNWQNFMP